MNTLDASIFDNNSNYGSDTFINELRTKTTNILRKEFPTSYQKQQIKQDVNGLVIACPYCGDSTTRLSMKRGHLMMKGKWSGFYKCFNCGRFTPIHKFMHDFHEDLSLSGVKYVQEHKQEIGTYRRDQLSENPYSQRTNQCPHLSPFFSSNTQTSSF